MELHTAAEIVAAANAGDTDRCRLIAKRGCVLTLIREARELVLTPEFQIVKPARSAGFYVFENDADEPIVILPTRKKAQFWIDRQIALRLELVEEASNAAEIAAADRAKRAARIAAARAAAPVQMDMFA